MTVNNTSASKEKFIDIDPMSYFGFYDQNGNGMFDLYEDKIKFGSKALKPEESVKFLENLWSGGIKGKYELTPKYVASLFNAYLVDQILQKQIIELGIKKKPVGVIDEADMLPKFKYSYSGEKLKQGLDFYIKPYWPQYQQDKFLTDYPGFFIMKTSPAGCDGSPHGRRQMCWPASAEFSAMVFLVKLPEPLGHMKMLVTSPMLSTSLKDHAFPIEIYGYAKSCIGYCQKFVKLGNNSYTSYKGLFKELYFKGYKFVDPKKYGEACYKSDQTLSGGGCGTTWNFKMHGR